MIHRLSILLLSLTLLFLSGCQSLSQRKISNELLSTLKAYKAVIRWGNLTQAYGFLRPEANNPLPRTNLKNIRIIGYDVVNPPVAIKPGVVRQWVLIRYVVIDTQVVRELNDIQLWGRDENDSKWYRLNPVPEFKQP